MRCRTFKSEGEMLCIVKGGLIRARIEVGKLRNCESTLCEGTSGLPVGNNMMHVISLTSHLKRAAERYFRLSRNQQQITAGRRYALCLYRWVQEPAYLCDRDYRLPHDLKSSNKRLSTA